MQHILSFYSYLRLYIDIFKMRFSYIFAWATLSSLPAQEALHFTGSMDSAVLLPDGTRHYPIQVGFDAWVTSGKWKIKVQYRGDEKYEEVGCDGGAVYGFLFDSAGPLDVKTGKRVSSNVIAGSIVDGQLPLNYTWFHFVPWFAFYSPYYFDAHGESAFIPAPWANPRHELLSLHEFTLERFELSPNFPKKADFILTKKSIRESVKRNWMNENMATQEMHASQYPDDFLSGTYEVLESSEFRSTVVPTKIRIQRFQPGGPGGQSWLCYQINLEVKSFEAASLDDYRPSIPDGAIVSPWDTRLRDPATGITGITYMIKDRKWPTAPPSDQVDRFKMEQEAKLAAQGVFDIRKRFLRGAVGLLIVGPLLVYAILRLRRVRFGG